MDDAGGLNCTGCSFPRTDVSPVFLFCRSPSTNAQQAALEVSKTHKVYSYIPLLIPVQSLFRSLGSDAVENACEDPERLIMEYLATQPLADALKNVPKQQVLDSIQQAFRARRVVLLMDGMDEAVTLRPALNRLVRTCVRIGVRTVATSRKEGVDDESKYKREDGWTTFGLPPLTLDQQQKIVHTLVNKTGEKRKEVIVFFDNLFKFSESRSKYDEDFENLAESDCNWLQTKTLSVISGRRIQVAKDGKSVDDGLPREDLVFVYDTLKNAENAGPDFLKNLYDKVLPSTESMLVPMKKKAFIANFNESVTRVFELYEIAAFAKEKFDSTLAEVCIGVLAKPV